MEEIDLKELISMFMKRKVLIILVVIIFALIGAIYTLKFITPTYKSSTSLVLVQTGAEGKILGDTGSITTSDMTLNSKLVSNYRLIATRDAVTSKVIQNLNLDMTPSELGSLISVTVMSDTELLLITVEYTDPELACKIAGEVANVFIDTVNQLYKLDNLHVLDQAKVDYTPANINLGKNVVIFAFVGAVLVSGYILLINMLDTTVKSDTDIERALEVPVLASIVLTNENAKKNIQKQADNLYRMSGFESNDEHGSVEKESVFENYDNNDEDIDTSSRLDEVEENDENNENDDETPSYLSNNYRSRKHKRNKGKNRRNG